jgi:hypothetical protein
LLLPAVCSLEHVMLGRLGVALAVGFLKLLALLPYGITARFGDGLGWLLYQIPSAARQSRSGISGTRSAATSSAACSGSDRRKSSKS